MKIHLIGIGGIGVSALAQYYLSKGHEVSGSDLAPSEITDFLKEKGVKIIIGNFAKNVEKDLDLVVYSPAVKKGNKELAQAIKHKIKTQSYPEALGGLTRDYYTIAVAGAHGKSTTTSMIALILIEAGLDPTVIVGTKLKEFGDSNFRAGKSRLLVIEACEYDSSFLYYSPQIAVVTNIDKEHLDFFKTFANVKKAFEKFILKLPRPGESGYPGFFIRNADDINAPVIIDHKFQIKDYSLKQAEAKKIKSNLKIPGAHNVSNALAALEVARILAIPDKDTFSALSKFNGTWRRFEILKETKNFTLISDYAHHPNEILATLIATREKYPKKQIWCVFQPHQHQRTFYLFNDFIKTFREVPIDKIILTDIYDVAGREIPTSSRTHDGIGAKIKEVSSKKLAEEVNKKNVSYLPIDEIEVFVKENIKLVDVLVIMGAGDIYKLADKF